MQLSQLGEFAAIDQLKKITEETLTSKVLLGIGDDAAILESLRRPVVSTDALIENVHFRREWTSPRQLGQKAMAVNLSDMAAMGASPVAVTVTLALPKETDLEWAKELYRGMADMALKYDCGIVGGDTTRASEIMISITIIGEIEAPQTPNRSRALLGDVIVATGTLGDSAAGLALLQNGHKDNEEPFARYCLERHLTPTPRLREMYATFTRGGDVRAAIDISDGLVGDAQHIAECSQVDMVIDVDQVPLSDQMQQAGDFLKHAQLQWALSGGEDYELLLCVSRKRVDDVIDVIQKHCETPAQRIGTCQKMASEKPRVHLTKNGKPFDIPQGWRHF